MRKDDARQLDHKTLEEMRAAKRSHDGESPAIVARVLGCDGSTVYGWLARYRRGGWTCAAAAGRRKVKTPLTAS